MTQGPKIRLGQIGKAIHRADGKIIDNDDVVEGIVLLRKGADSDATLEAIHDKVNELNEHILPAGRARSFRFSTAATWCTTPRTRCCTT